MTRQMVRKRGGQSGGKKMKEEEELGTYARDGTQLPYSYFHFHHLQYGLFSLSHTEIQIISGEKLNKTTFDLFFGFIFYQTTFFFCSDCITLILRCNSGVPQQLRVSVNRLITESAWSSRNINKGRSH